MTTFIIKEYPISSGTVLDIVIPAGFVGLRAQGRAIKLRAISDLTYPDRVQRFEFLVLELDTETEEPIAYDGAWILLGCVGSRTVFYKHIYD